MFQRIYLILSALLLLPLLGLAQPNFKQVVECEGLRCFRDIEKADVAYYAPGVLSIATDRNGKPDFNFLETRYTGNTAYNDRGESRFMSIIRFKVRMEQIPAEKLSLIKKTLWPSANGHLRPVPIANIKTILVFTPVTTMGEEDKQPTVLSDGNLSADTPEGISQKGEYWKEREFTLRVDNNSAQLLGKAFEKGQSLMSLSYAFFSKGVNQLGDDFITEGEGEILDKIMEQAEEQRDTTLQQVCIKSDAFTIAVDSHKWPDLVKQVDINEEIPPGYAAIEVRCYDFNNNLRPDLFAKKIEIKAKGVGQGDVVVKKTFRSKSPDIYMFSIKFPYAVRLDKPLYYRTTSISDSSAPIKTEWIEQDLWTNIIDITSDEDQIIDDNE